MAKRTPSLQFTKEELLNPAVEEAAKKANRRVQKLEQAEEKIPKKKVVEKEPKESRSSSPHGAQPPKKASSRAP